MKAPSPSLARMPQEEMLAEAEEREAEHAGEIAALDLELSSTRAQLRAVEEAMREKGTQLVTELLGGCDGDGDGDG